MTDGPTEQELVDAKFLASERGTDLKLERILSEMRVSQTQLGERVTGAMGVLQQELRGDFKALEARMAGKVTVILTGVGVAAVVVAMVVGMATSGQQMFGLGQSTRDIATSAATAAADRVLAQQKK